MEKLTIRYTDKKLKDRKPIEVLFNPTEYTVEDSSTWQDFKKPRENPELQYTGGARKTISMDLFFDTYERGEDVRVYTGEIARLLVPTINDGGQGKRPPKVRLSWGKAEPQPDTGIFVFEWVLEKLTQKFTLFTEDGMPVRATLTVTFKEFVLPKDEAKRTPRRSSFPVQTYTIKAGDTLSGIAADLWEDPTRWRVIADKNALDNPRVLEIGKVLIVPKIE